MAATAAGTLPEFPYKTDYNDHFVTPRVAFEDIAPVLDWLAAAAVCPTTFHHADDANFCGANNIERRKVLRSQITIYDPYYCDGTSARLLQDFGYKKVMHDKRDFYQDIAQGTVPEHDVLVTNPPYSESHKKQCVDYCHNARKPFALLMPSYVATKQYMKNDDWLYLVPSASYQYNHPEGTGHNVSPFRSLWYIGGVKDRNALLAFQQRQAASMPKLASSLDELAAMDLVSLQNRPGARERRQRKVSDKEVSTARSGASTRNLKKRKKCSKYRDETGQRTRRRF